MSAILDDLKARALELAPPERDELIRALIESVDGPADGSPQEVAQAWSEEIARRIAEYDAGKSKGIPADEVFEKSRALIGSHAKR